MGCHGMCTIAGLHFFLFLSVLVSLICSELTRYWHRYHFFICTLTWSCDINLLRTMRIPFEIFRFAGKHEKKLQRHNWQDGDWYERGERKAYYSDDLSWKKHTRRLVGGKSYSQKKMLWRATLFWVHDAALVHDDGNRWMSANTAYFGTLLI